MPIWLKKELQEAEFIPKLELPPDDETNTKDVPEKPSTPTWLQAEIDEADLLAINKKEVQADELSFTEDGDLGVGTSKVSRDVPDTSVNDEDESEDLKSYLGRSMSKSDCIRLIAELQEKVDRLETENQKLHKTVAQQLDRITDLENECRKFDMQQTV